MKLIVRSVSIALVFALILATCTTALAAPASALYNKNGVTITRQVNFLGMDVWNVKLSAKVVKRLLEAYEPADVFVTILGIGGDVGIKCLAAGLKLYKWKIKSVSNNGANGIQFTSYCPKTHGLTSVAVYNAAFGAGILTATKWN